MDSLHLQARRTYPVSAPALYELWACPELLNRWLPRPLPTTLEEQIPGRRIVFTWAYPDTESRPCRRKDDEFARTTLILEFRPISASLTELVLTQFGFVGELSCSAQLAFWNAILDVLSERTLAQDTLKNSGVSLAKAI